MRTHEVLVDLPGMDAGDEDLPNAAVAPAHGVAVRVPLVEIACHRDHLGVRRPDRESHSLNALHLHHVRAHRLPGLVQRAFVVEVNVEVAQ